MSKVVNITDKDELEGFINYYNRVVVDFHALSWCAPCRAFKPHFERAAGALAYDVVFCTVDIDDNPWATEVYGVRSVPTVMLFEDGQYVRNLAPTSAMNLINDLRN